jgi:hypothetical protein
MSINENVLIVCDGVVVADPTIVPASFNCLIVAVIATVEPDGFNHDTKHDSLKLTSTFVKLRVVNQSETYGVNSLDANDLNGELTKL